jgi:hypothetical protein
MGHRIAFQVEHLGDTATEDDLGWYVAEVAAAARLAGIEGARCCGYAVEIDSAEDADRLRAVADRVYESGEGWA